MSEYPTCSPGERLSLMYSGTVVKRRFANYGGSVCGADQLPAGITDADYVDGNFGSVIKSGTALLRIKAQLAQGAPITSDADGCGILATAGDYVGAIARFAGVTNTDVEVILSQFKL